MTTFRDLPAIDRLINAPAIAPLLGRHGPERVKAALRALQQSWRDAGSVPEWAAEPEAYVGALDGRLGRHEYQPVFNLTGTIIHTNLGRALLSAETFAAVEPLVTRPMNLEFDLESGKRGHRDGVVADKLRLLTGAEAATVVNNGAAALMLVLNTFALDRSVPVSRGELIEIGGSFRLPDIMARSGCRLTEVGTTNRTHLEDFEAAIDDETGLLLKVHPSNFHVSGFTSAVATADLVALAHRSGLPVCVDLGSGSLVDLTRWGLPFEPMPQQLIEQGVDLVTFSGDKLLGAVQAGIILGRRDLIDALNRNPMKRALRADKLTLTFLSKTLSLYEEPELLPERLPLLRTLTTPLHELEQRAAAVAATLANRLPGCQVDIAPGESQIGSGSLPDRTIPSVCVRISADTETRVRALHEHLRKLAVPVIGRVQQGSVWLDMRGAEHLDDLCATLTGLDA